MPKIIPKNLRNNAFWFVGALVVIAACTTVVITPDTHDSPEILVVGDSQISFGAGEFHLKFFENLETHCSADKREKQLLAKLGEASANVIGVRSTSLHTWVLPGKDDKALLCDVDEKFGVNAGAYGMGGNPNRQYIQVGQGAPYQFCRSGRTAFQEVFKPGYYAPKLFVMAFLGNAAERWATSRQSAFSDTQKAIRQIPKGTPCIFMTTAPSYLADVNDLRQRAQANAKAAFAAAGNRCSFVEGITPATRRANQGNKSRFRTNEAGAVTDPLHPGTEAAEKFFDLIKPELCKAVFRQLKR